MKKIIVNFLTFVTFVNFLAYIIPSHRVSNNLRAFPQVNDRHIVCIFYGESIANLPPAHCDRNYL